MVDSFERFHCFLSQFHVFRTASGNPIFIIAWVWSGLTWAFVLYPLLEKRPYFRALYREFYAVAEVIATPVLWHAKYDIALPVSATHSGDRVWYERPGGLLGYATDWRLISIRQRLQLQSVCIPSFLFWGSTIPRLIGVDYKGNINLWKWFVWSCAGLLWPVTFLHGNIFCYDLHIPHDRRVQNACVMSCHVGIGMSEHFGHIIDCGAAARVSVANVWRAVCVDRCFWILHMSASSFRYIFIFWLLHTGRSTLCAWQ